MFDELDSLEKAALNEILNSAREIYKKEKLNKVTTFEQWLQDIAKEMRGVLDKAEKKD